MRLGAGKSTTESHEAPKLPRHFGAPPTLRVVVYADPADMLEPMDAETFERRLVEQLAAFSDPPAIERVPFDKERYVRWLCGRKDTHARRAKWAVEL